MDEPTPAGGSSAQGTAAPTRFRPLLTRPRVIVLVLIVVTGALVAVQLAGFLSAGQGAAVEQSSPSTGSRAVVEYAAQDRAEPVVLSGTGLTGESIDIAAWRGDVVVINVWGSWCAPCREEAPILAALAVNDHRRSAIGHRLSAIGGGGGCTWRGRGPWWTRPRLSWSTNVSF